MSRDLLYNIRGLGPIVSVDRLGKVVEFPLAREIGLEKYEGIQEKKRPRESGKVLLSNA